MSRIHVVVQGECLTAIAARYGVADPASIYDDAENEALRARRPDPNLLLPGDHVVIPEVAREEYVLTTGQRHRIVIKRPRRLLRVRLDDVGSTSLEGERFELAAPRRSPEPLVRGTVEAKNLIRASLPASVSRVFLDLPDRGLRFELMIGHLDPLGATDGSPVVWSGVQARLANLGFFGGAVDGRPSDELTRAIAEFQRQVLGREDAAGALDAETRDRLESEHGH